MHKTQFFQLILNHFLLLITLVSKVRGEYQTGNIYLSLHQFLCVWTVGVHSSILSITCRFLKFTNTSFIKNTLLTTYL